MRQLELLQTNAPDNVVAHVPGAQLMKTTALASTSVFALEHSETLGGRQQKDHCQLCGMFAFAKWSKLIFYMEDVLRSCFISLCEACYREEQARVERNRRRRRGW